MLLTYVLTSSTVEVFYNGRGYSMPGSHQNFDALIMALNKKDKKQVDRILEGLNHATKKVQKMSNGRLKVKGGEVTYDGEQIHGTMVDRLFEFVDAKIDATPLFNFVKRIMQNPDKTVLEHLYTFLEHGKLPITEDGHFLAYKVVRSNYKDKHSGTFDNSPGNVASMPRNAVDPNRNNECSYGLHFCSFPYLSHFYSAGDKVVLVKIDPVDVVSIPRDYNNTKARCCKYTVVEDVTSMMTKKNEAIVQVEPKVMKSHVLDTSTEEGLECEKCGHTHFRRNGTVDRKGVMMRRLRCKSCDASLYVELEAVVNG